MPEGITERQIQIIRAIVNEYVLTGEPVGSNALVDKFGFTISPATVRKEMSVLEQMGFLKSPHTSAGRIPADAAFEIYIEDLINLYEITLNHKNQLDEFYRSAQLQLDQLLKSIAQMLAMTSNQLGVVLSPVSTDSVLKRIELVSVLDNLVLAVMVSQSGSVFQKKIKLDRPISQEELYKISRFLNQNVKGYELSQFRDRGLEFLSEGQRHLGDNASVAMNIAQALVFNPPDQTVYVEGENQLFASILEASAQREDAEFLIRRLSDEAYLCSVFNHVKNSKHVTVQMGLDIDGRQFGGFALLAKDYAVGGRSLGALGVIGVNRMPYERLIPTLDYSAQILSNVLSQRAETSEANDTLVPLKLEDII